MKELLKDGISIFVDRAGTPYFGSLSISDGIATVVLLVDDEEEVSTVPEFSIKILDVVDKDGNVQITF